MNRIALFSFALCALLLPAGVSAQSTSTQSDPHTYNDPAMSYTAPADYIPIPMQPEPPTGFNGTVVQAAYIRHPKQQDSTIITLRMEAYTDDLDSYEQAAESEARNAGSDQVFIHKTMTTLSNGMPAYFLDITIGQDVGEQRVFEWVWVDGVRGVSLSIAGRFGTIDDRSAKKALSSVSAVAYPKNRY